MSFMDDIKNKAAGSSEGTGAVSAILQLVNSHPGGFSGLLQTFHERGLGGVVSSWVGTGENQAITAEQIQKVLGNDKIKQFAAKVGISPEQASTKIAEYLPQVVDKLTPNGRVPSDNVMELGKDLLKSPGGKVA